MRPTLPLRPLLLLTAAALAASCGTISGSRSDTGASTGSAGTGAVTTGAAGAGAAGTTGAAGTGGAALVVDDCASGTLTPGERTEMLIHDGVSRNYIIHVPARYDGKTPAPLVMEIHGLRSNANQRSAISGWRAKADSVGFVVVCPTASTTHGTAATSAAACPSRTMSTTRAS